MSTKNKNSLRAAIRNRKRAVAAAVLPILNEILPLARAQEECQQRYGHDWLAHFQKHPEVEAYRRKRAGMIAP